MMKLATFSIEMNRPLLVSGVDTALMQYHTSFVISPHGITILSGDIGLTSHPNFNSTSPGVAAMHFSRMSWGLSFIVLEV
jgi:hypothetical protein